jgi:hypothetical protein
MVGEQPYLCSVLLVPPQKGSQGLNLESSGSVSFTSFFKEDAKIIINVLDGLSLTNVLVKGGGRETIVYISGLTVTVY